MTASTDRARLRKAAGPDRPSYFGSGDVDRVMAVVLALASEVAALRERLDTHEQLAKAGTSATPQHVDDFAADSTAEATREVWRDAYIKRLFRVITEDLEAMGTTEAPET